jgi:hypothetical protein
MDDLESLIGQRIEAAHAEVERLFSESLYGDRLPRRKRGRLERFWDWVCVMRYRIEGAWLVLTGRADIS